jgi:hypothetical protein
MGFIMINDAEIDKILGKSFHPHCIYCNSGRKRNLVLKDGMYVCLRCLINPRHSMSDKKSHRYRDIEEIEAVQELREKLS